MTTENFTYWLQGFFEISDEKFLNVKQVQVIKDNLALVFNKQTPDKNEEQVLIEISKNLSLHHTLGVVDLTEKVPLSKSKWTEQDLSNHLKIERIVSC